MTFIPSNFSVMNSREGGGGLSMVALTRARALIRKAAEISRRLLIVSAGRRSEGLVKRKIPLLGAFSSKERIRTSVSRMATSGVSSLGVVTRVFTPRVRSLSVIRLEFEKEPQIRIMGGIPPHNTLDIVKVNRVKGV
jgi:hypothetical protein